MPDPSIAARLAAHVLGLRHDRLPPPARAAARTFILDSLGVGIAGSSVPHAGDLLRLAAGWGVAPEAQAWGRRARLPAAGAAFLNAWQMHNQEFDCLHEGAVVHVMASVLPVALALAERRGGVSGTALMEAVAAGVDVGAALGLAAAAGMRFFRPATAGGFGAVAAGARILGLDPPALERAFAFQLAQASGTMQAHVEGSAILPMQVGFNAAAAVRSCELAALAVDPPRAVFEGPFGYLNLFEGGGDLTPLLDTLGHRFLITELSHKPYPAGRATHAGIEGALALQQAHGFAAADVAEVVATAPPLIARLVGRPPRLGASASYARLCMGVAVAQALRHRGLDLAHFRDGAPDDPAVQALAARVRTEPKGTDPNALAPQHVAILLNDGRRLEWRCETMLASPARPLDRAAHFEKFRRCLAFSAEPLAADAAQRLIALTDHLDSVPDIAEMCRNLAPAP